MAVKPIPAGYRTVTPYLVVPGAARLIDFLKQAFNAKEMHRMTHTNGSIMHAEVRIGDSRVMIGEPAGQSPTMPAMLYLYVKDTDATYKSALAAGGTSLKEPSDQFYGDRNAGIQDPCGNRWWIATHVEDVAPEEMTRRTQEAMRQRGAA